MNAARADMVAARERTRVALGGWFPQLNVNGQYGYEKQIQPGADTRAPPASGVVSGVARGMLVFPRFLETRRNYGKCTVVLLPHLANKGSVSGVKDILCEMHTVV